MATFSTLLSTNYRLEHAVTYGTPNRANKTIPVTHTLLIRKLAGSGYWSNYTASWNFNVGGFTDSGTISSYDFRNYTTLTLASRTHSVPYNANGTKTISCTSYFSAGSGTVGAGSTSGSVVLPPIPVIANIVSVATPVTAGNDFVINWTAVSSGLSYDIEFWDANDTTNLFNRRGYKSSGTTRITPTAAELAKVYDGIKNPGGSNFIVRLATFEGSTYLGMQKKAVFVKPAGFSIWGPSSFTLGQDITASWVKKATSLYFMGGLGHGGSFLSGEPVRSDGSTLTRKTSVASLRDQIFRKAGTNTSVPLRFYIREYTSLGNELSISTFDVTCHIPQPTVSTAQSVTTSSVATTLTFANVLTSIDGVWYSHNGGPEVYAGQPTGNKLVHTLTGLATGVTHTIRYRYRMNQYSKEFYTNTLSFVLGSVPSSLVQVVGFTDSLYEFWVGATNTPITDYAARVGTNNTLIPFPPATGVFKHDTASLVGQLVRFYFKERDNGATWSDVVRQSATVKSKRIPVITTQQEFIVGTNLVAKIVLDSDMTYVTYQAVISLGGKVLLTKQITSASDLVYALTDKELGPYLDGKDSITLDISVEGIMQKGLRSAKATSSTRIIKGTNAYVYEQGAFRAKEVQLSPVKPPTDERRNFLKLSGASITTPDYIVQDYAMTTQYLTEEDDVVITLKGSLGKGKEHFRAYNSGGTSPSMPLEDLGNGIYQYVGKWVMPDVPSPNTYLRIHSFLQTVTGVLSTIEWIKLERGTVGTPYYPAPEDGDTYPNFVKKDFSDWSNNLGSSAVFRKTFPIWAFNGGRNLLLDSKGTIDLTKLTWKSFEYETWEERGE